MKVLLDSSFILSCVMKRIDFLSQLEEQGFRVEVPREVLQELKDLKHKDKTSRDERTAIDTALQMIEGRKIKKTTLGEGSVDEWLIRRGNEGFFIATLDNEIKRSVPNKIVIFDSKKSVGAE